MNISWNISYICNIYKMFQTNYRTSFSLSIILTIENWLFSQACCQVREIFKSKLQWKWLFCDNYVYTSWYDRPRYDNDRSCAKCAIAIAKGLFVSLSKIAYILSLSWLRLNVFTSVIEAFHVACASSAMLTKKYNEGQRRSRTIVIPSLVFARLRTSFPRTWYEENIAGSLKGAVTSLDAFACKSQLFLSPFNRDSRQVDFLVM